MRRVWVALAALPLLGADASAFVEASPRTGTIVGTVRVEEAPARRRAPRYTRGRVESARTIQPLPVVAYLRGSLPGGGGRMDPVMAQQDTAFVPGVLVVRSGTTVEFPNRDDFFHNVFSYSDAQRFDLGRYPEGESKSVTFRTPGVAKVYCEVHEFMRSAVIVVENDHHEIVRDGTFIL
ncbi:MAG: plastocyanin/azurin family copper-binding protein, partial [Halobacteriales archaeon]|nr:plastocyanin/azurin family copper-binding protein [Halobacteriales archaeon]